LISGARDDIFHQYYTTLRLQRNRNAEVGIFEASPATIDAKDRKSQATSTFEEDIEVILGKLKRVGLNQVIVFDLTPPGWEISVVRVIVPGLEASFHTTYNPKKRAIAFAERQLSRVIKPTVESKRVVETHRPAGGTS
jgi:ribosomal protein S12 methylthiotransferase accessory factor